jgi:hypothetical protein
VQATNTTPSMCRKTISSLPTQLALVRKPRKFSKTPAQLLALHVAKANLLTAGPGWRRPVFSRK